MTNNNVLPEGHESLMTLNGRHFTATYDGINITGKVVVNEKEQEVYLENDTENIASVYCPEPVEFDYMMYLCQGSEGNLEGREIFDFRITD